MLLKNILKKIFGDKMENNANTSHKQMMVIAAAQNQRALVGVSPARLEELIKQTEKFASDSVKLRKYAASIYGNGFQRFVYSLQLRLDGKKASLQDLADNQYDQAHGLNLNAFNALSECQRAYHNVVTKHDHKLDAPVEIFQRLKELRIKFDEIKPKIDILQTDLDSDKYSISEEPEVYVKKKKELVKLQRQFSQLIAEYDVGLTRINLAESTATEYNNLEGYTLRALVTMGKVYSFLSETEDRLDTYRRSLPTLATSGEVLQKTTQLVGLITTDSKKVVNDAVSRLERLPRDLREQELVSLGSPSIPEARPKKQGQIIDV